ncbi:MAG: helix-turn-helix transcriptional regulator [Pseudonocardia sp.]|nr:helix-turn-helix transcriptional regulator [Pseudonocardia sp.]
MQDRFRYDLGNCSIARSLELLGEKWTFLIVREAWYGIGRFADFERALGCTRSLLADRLHMLVGAGVLATEPYREPGARTRQRYVLTTKGRELLPVLIALREWGDRHLADPAGPPVQLHHRDCGHRVSLALQCTRGHMLEGADELIPAEGPGLRLAEADLA